MNLQNLQQENCLLSMIKITQNMVKEMKMKKTIKFEAKVIEAFLCDYSDAYILVTGYIRAAADDANTKVTFKNCTPFTKRITHINDEHVGNAKNFDIIIPMYNLTEYSVIIQILQEVYGSLKEMNQL